MKKRFVFFVVSSAVLFMAHPGFSQQRQKLAQTGLKFLSVTTDARAGAMGGAYTSLQSSSAAMFFNPAGMAKLDGLAQVSFGMVNWIADIDYSFGSAAFNPSDGKYGIFGVTLVAVDYGQLIGTIRDRGESGYVETGNFSPTALAAGLGYAKAITDKFSVGANIKYVKQDLKSGIIALQSDGSRTSAGFSKEALAFDFGILYHTGFKSLDFGMTVRNFSRELKYLEEGFQLPLTFKMGVSMNAMDFIGADKKENVFLVSVDAVHPRDYPEQLSFGGEYLFRKLVALRAGYSFPNDEHGFSAGGGLQKAFGSTQFALDYAYTPFGVFDAVNRFTVQFAF